MQSWIAAELTGVADETVFPTVDAIDAGMTALAAEYPNLVRANRVGTSRMGHPLLALTIGSAVRQALVFAVPHPNEPVGALTALHLARRLCESPELLDRLGHTFTIIGCADPDGLRLNEGWLAGPFTRTHYARHFYRPAGDEQVEWTFPIDYRGHYFDGMLPETTALARLIDTLRPSLMVSLHNSELGGAYYYLSRPEPLLYPDLQQIPTSLGVPLDRGEPESPEIPVLADGIFHGLGFKPLLDSMHAAGRDISGLRGGDTSGSHAARYGTLTLISEVPYWSHPDSSDTRPATRLRSDLLADQAAAMGQLAQLLTRILAECVPSLMASQSPLASASRYFADVLTEHAADTARRAADPAERRLATVAEAFAIADLVHCFRLRYGGMLLRLLDGEIAVGNARAAIRVSRDELAAAFERWCAASDRADAQTRTLPIRALVATQYGAILAAADLLHQRKL